MPASPSDAPRLPLFGGSRRRIELAAAVTDEQHVRIGQTALAIEPGTVLSAVGLGSCIGVMVVHQLTGIAAAAHVFLPDSGGREDVASASPGKFADTAIPALVEQLTAASRRVRPNQLVAVLVGGSQMFKLGGLADASDVGGRNLTAVRDALRLAGIPVVAADCGGSQGRTARVYAGSCTVTSQVVGQDETTIFDGEAARVQRAA